MKRTVWETFVTYAILTLGGMMLAFPFYYMAVTSIKTGKEVNQPVPTFLVHHPSVEAFGDLLKDPLVYHSIFNSVIIAFLQTVGTLFFCTLAGYAFAKHRFPGKNGFFIVLLATMMIPGAVLMIPGFLLFRDFGWLDTWAPLIIPGLGGAFGVFLARQFIERIPDSLVECARMEGCREPRIYSTIILPLSKPLIATLAILTFLGSWNNLIGPLIVLLTESKFTLTLTISMLQGRFPGRDNVQMAGAMISIVPLMVLFFVLQKHVVASLTSSGLKDV